MICKTKILYILPLFSFLPSLHSDFSPRLCASQKFVNAPALPFDKMSRDRNVSGALGAIESAWQEEGMSGNGRVSLVRSFTVGGDERIIISM